MKVLHVNDYRSLGGAEVVMAVTVSLLRDRGLEVETFTAADVTGLRRTPLTYVNSPKARRALEGRLASFKPDVVHLHNFYHVLSPGILAVLAREKRRRPLRVVMTAHDYHLVCPSAGLFYVSGGLIQCGHVDRLGSIVYLLSHRWDQRSAAHSLLKVAQHVWNYRLHRRRRVIDCVICPSRYVEGIFTSRGLPTCFVPHPVPPQERASSRSADELRLVFAGRVESEKGVVELLEMWPVDFGGRLTIVGEGSRLSRCRTLARQRGLDVQFTGAVSREDVATILGQNHVLVLPSLVAETYGMSLVEALAAGTNILVSDLGAMREIVESSGTGFRYTTGDAKSLAEALDRVHRSFRNGALNQFDVSAFVRARSGHLYTDRLLEVYKHGS